MLKLNKFHTIIGSAICFLAIFAFLTLKDVTQSKFIEDKAASWTINVQSERKYWSDFAEKYGTKEAYSALKEKYKESDLETQHVMAHMFGEILYTKENIQGLRVCDQFFGFGCFHGFIIKTIGDHGIDIVTELDKICREVTGPQDSQCQHGIGHGLVEYFGAYDPGKMLKVIETCDKMTHDGLYSECIVGAFMAYRESIFTDRSGSIRVSIRKIDSENPYSPCIESTKRARGLCYAGLGLWLDLTLKGDYKKIGDYCNGITNKNDRNLCIFGVGLVAATQSEYEAQKTIEKCASLAKDNELLCRAAAYISTKALKEKVIDPAPMCGDLNSRDTEYCMTLDPQTLFQKSAYE